MAREKELYRENIALIRERYGERMTLTIKEASAYLGLCERTVRKFDVFVNGTKIVSVPKLARILS